MTREQLGVSEFHFGPCSYSLTRRELRYAGIRCVIPLQESQVLETLLRHPGEVITKQMLSAVLWPGRVHGETDRAIHNLISKLRRMHPAMTVWIVTIPKSGYKLDIPVTIENNVRVIEVPVATAASSPAGPVGSSESRAVLPRNELPTAESWIRNSVSHVLARVGSRTRRFFLWTSCAILFAAAFFAVHHVFIERDRPPAAASVSLTVFSFRDSGGAVGEAETLREQLADDLAAVPHVEVSVSHSPLSGSTAPGRAESIPLPKADFWLDGEFAAAGDSYSLNLELIRGRDRVHLLSRHYVGSRSSLGSLPDRIAGDLAGPLHHGPQAEAQRLLGSTTSEQAYDFAFRAQTHLLQRSRPDVEKASDLYHKALALDPRFARAWAGLSESEVVLANFGTGAETRQSFEEARRAAQQALMIDPNNAQAHSSLGTVLLQQDWRLREAERQMRLAISLNPGNAASHLRLAVLLADEDREKDASEEIDRAHQVDPQWAVVHGTSMYVHLMSRRYNEAIADGQMLVSLQPDWSRAQQQLGWALWYAGRHAHAVACWKRAAELDRDETEAHLEEEGLDILERSGVRAYAEFRIARHIAERRGEEDFVPAEWHAFAGDREGTLRALEAMVHSRDPESLKLRVNPAYDFVRHDNRFIVLTREIADADNGI